MKHRRSKPRNNPVRDEFNCDLFNEAFQFVFPEKRQQQWWAQMLVQRVIESQKRFPASTFAPTLKALDRAEPKDLRCGALVKTIEKITRLGNGEDWLRYGLQGYIDQAWPKGDASSLLLLLSKQDPQLAYVVLQELFNALYLPLLRRLLTKQEAMRFVVMMNEPDLFKREEYFLDFVSRASVEATKDPKSLASLAWLAWTYADVMHYLLGGRFPAAARWKVREMESRWPYPSSGSTLADGIRARVPRLIV